MALLVRRRPAPVERLVAQGAGTRTDALSPQVSPDRASRARAAPIVARGSGRMPHGGGLLARSPYATAPVRSKFRNLSSLVGAALAAGVAPHGHARKPRKTRAERAPDVQAKILEARSLEPRDLVEHAMVELAAHHRALALDFSQVRDETGRRIGLALDRDLDLEGMTVDAAVAMALGRAVEAMRGVEPEAVGDLHR